MYLLKEWVIRVRLLKYRRTEPPLASHLIVTGADKTQSIVTLERRDLDWTDINPAQQGSTSFEVSTTQTFTYRFKTYIKPLGDWNFSELEFVLSQDLLGSLGAGLSTSVSDARQQLYGESVIDVPMPSVFYLLYKEVIHPFFVFQVFSIILWFAEGYVLYSATILVLSVLSLLVNLFETKRNIKNVRELAHYECPVEIYRDMQWRANNSKALVPGDLFKVQEQVLPCDCVLFEGSVLVDESMLTGEAQPVLKEAGELKKARLYAGTRPLACRGNVLAIVKATGYATAKGQLVRSILFPKPSKFNFYSDSFKFIGVMGVLAVVGFLWCVPSFLEEDQKPSDMVMNLLDLVTIIVPPALPLATMVGISFAIARLKAKGVYCISPPTINSAGRVSVAVFDKTGTLTSDSMTLEAVWDVQTGCTQDLPRCTPLFVENMVTCHSLTLHNTEMIGDPMEVAIVQRLGAQLIEVPDCKFLMKCGSRSFKVLKVIDFSSDTRRMGTVVSEAGLRFHVKGAPEVVLPLCGGVTEEAKVAASMYMKKGYRVLACACKVIDSAEQERTALEHQMEFLGYLLFVNSVKDKTVATLSLLNNGNVSTYMSTGDALLTAVAVGQECGFVDEDVLIGDADDKWQDAKGNKTELRLEAPCFALSGGYLEDLLTREDPRLAQIIPRARVFARMSPSQKVMLVEYLQSRSLFVAMVGDGANDCGALKAADVGLSLSDAEASIAAPFTGKVLPQFVEVLKEGRASLVTSFQAFKFICMYSMIQFITINILYIIHNSLLDSQFLYQDLVIILPLAVFMAYTKAHHSLADFLPPGSLVSFHVLSSIIGQVIIQGMFLILAYQFLVSQSFYEESSPGVEHARPNFENTVLFLVSNAELIFVCICFSVGPPFRQSAFKNIWFALTVCVLLGLEIYSLMAPDKWTRQFFGLVETDTNFRWKLLGLLGLVLTGTWAYEHAGVKLLGMFARLFRH